VLPLALARDMPDGAGGALTLGVRASAVRVAARPGDVALPGTVELAEISGSDTFVHAQTAVGDIVAQLGGVHNFELGSAITVYLNPAQVYAFGAGGERLAAPERMAVAA
ncbi:MAG: TOBE domain-containing protein, partial [Chitinophagaceae bacterium]|nr:TOBE domain-containing protein [Rubrivivax sp.]